MRSRFSTGWRSFFVATAAVSLILLPFSQAISGDRGDNVAGDKLGAPGLVQKGEELPSKVPTFSRANYTWPYAQGPYYGDQSVGKANGKEASAFFRTPVGVFDLSQGEPNFPAQLKAKDKRALGAAQYLVIQLDRESAKFGSIDELRNAVEGNGGQIVRELSDLTFIARVTPAGRSVVERSADVSASLLYPPAVKLHPSIGRVALTDPVKALSDVYELAVRIFPGEDAELVAQSLGQLGGNVIAVVPDTVRV